jgi:hypothetical protein
MEVKIIIDQRIPQVLEEITRTEFHPVQGTVNGELAACLYRAPADIHGNIEFRGCGNAFDGQVAIDMVKTAFEGDDSIRFKNSRRERIGRKKIIRGQMLGELGIRAWIGHIQSMPLCALTMSKVVVAMIVFF